jgi:hypothetical protein
MRVKRVGDDSEELFGPHPHIIIATMNRMLQCISIIFPPFMPPNI